MALGVIFPLIASAREGGSSTPIQYGSWVKVLDEKGDRNAIGKFNSNEANKKLVRFEGTVTVVSGTSVSVKRADSEGTVTTRTFKVDTSTAVIRKFKGTASIGEVSVGDKVKVWATASTDGTAKLIWDKSIWWVEVRGIVSALNVADQTFSVTITRPEPETGLSMTLTVPIKTTSGTTYGTLTDPKTFSDLANGQTVKLRGSFSAIGKYVIAKRVSIL